MIGIRPSQVVEVCGRNKLEIGRLYRQLGRISVTGHGSTIVVSSPNAIVTPYEEAVIHK